MAGSFTDYLETKLLDHTFRNVAYTSPGAVYLGLPPRRTPGEERS